MPTAQSQATPDITVDVLARHVRNARQVVYLCGAGLSVASGIRAYRTGPNAVWDENVLSWGTAERFHADPAAWWSQFWLKAHGDLFRHVEPNPGHLALVTLCRRNPSDLVITQNIDGLHRLAGHPESQLIEIHGRHDRFVCASGTGCHGVDHPVSSVDLTQLDAGVIPLCAECGAPMRPLVLLFDEHYDWSAAFQAFQARRALNAADVIVFVGTSFSVGITSYAIRCADVSGAWLCNANVEKAPFPQVNNLIGGAEVLLPALALACSAA